MKYLLLLTILLTSCAGWSRTDKALMASYLVFSTIDTVQTSQADKEYNPLLAKSDGSPDMTKVIVVKAVSGLGIYFIADQFPKYRTPLLIGVNIIQGGCVIYDDFEF